MKGITVYLSEKTQAGEDDFGAPIYEEKQIPVENVLIGEPSADDIVNDLNLYGKKLVYTLGIPKGDCHKWEDTTVMFFNRKFHTYGIPTEGIEDLIPLSWNKKVKVEYYE